MFLRIRLIEADELQLIIDELDAISDALRTQFQKQQLMVREVTAQTESVAVANEQSKHEHEHSSSSSSSHNNSDNKTNETRPLDAVAPTAGPSIGAGAGSRRLHLMGQLAPANDSSTSLALKERETRRDEVRCGCAALSLKPIYVTCIVDN